MESRKNPEREKLLEERSEVDATPNVVFPVTSSVVERVAVAPTREP